MVSASPTDRENSFVFRVVPSVEVLADFDGQATTTAIITLKEALRQAVDDFRVVVLLP